MKSIQKPAERVSFLGNVGYEAQGEGRGRVMMLRRSLRYVPRTRGGTGLGGKEGKCLYCNMR